MKKLLFVLLLVTIYSCKQAEDTPVGSNFYFENPQPIDDSELLKIPNKFIGNYINSDSTKLCFTESTITHENLYKFKIHKVKLDSLKSEFDIVNGRYIVKDTKEVFDTKVIGDSIEFSNKLIDTIFYFSNSQKAKRINGNLILNYKDSIYWKIKLISLNKDRLYIRQLYADSDLKSLDSITKIHSKKIDSISYFISPSRREFSKLLKLKNLGFKQEYSKVSK